MFSEIQPALQDFTVTVVTGVLAVLGGFLVALAKKGFNWVSSKIDLISDEKAQNALNNALSNLENIVVTTVTSLQQTLGDTIKESLKTGEGEYTQEDLMELKSIAIERVKAQLTESAKTALSTAYNDLESFISEMIEKAVRDLKNSESK